MVKVSSSKRVKVFVVSALVAVVLTLGMAGCYSSMPTAQPDEVDDKDTPNAISDQNSDPGLNADDAEGVDNENIGTTGTPKLVDTRVVTSGSFESYGLIKFMEDAQAEGNSPFHFVMEAAPEDDAIAFADSEADIAMVSISSAAKLYNSMDGDVRMIAITNLGDFNDQVGEGIGMTGTAPAGETTACAIARAKFVEDNVDTINEFLKQLQGSVEYALDNPTDAAKQAVEDGIAGVVSEAEEGMSQSGLTYLAGAGMQEKAEQIIKTLYDQDAESVGGKEPGNDFYYIA